MSSVLLDSTLSLYSIPIAWVTALYPHVVKSILIQNNIGYRIASPRGNIARMKSKESAPKDLVEKVVRLDGAHQNGLEVFPLWVSAVLAGNIAGLSNRTLNLCSVAFISSRVVYNYLYANTTAESKSFWRTIVWLTSIGVSMTLLIKSANKLRS